MARANSRRELFLQVSGSVDPLKTILKSGSSALVEFAGNAEKQLEAVEKSLQDLGGADPSKGAKQLARNYNAAFQEIRRNAEQVLSGNSGADAVNIVNASAARAAADAAEQRAAAIRVVADAARQEAVAQGNSNAQVTQYAAGAMAAARAAEEYANELRVQANTLTAVEGRMEAIVPVGKRVREMSGQARAGMQQLSYQLGDVAAQFASGTPPQIIFAQQIGQVTQAIGLMAGEAKGFIGFIGGPWGMAISSALVVLTPWVGKLLEGNDALAKGVDKLKEDAAQAEVTRRAHEAFTKTIEGQIAAQRALNKEIEQGIRSQRQLQLKRLDDARTNVTDLEKSRKAVEGQIAAQRKVVGSYDRKEGMPAGTGALAFQSAADEARKKLKALERQYADLTASISQGQESVRLAEVPLIQSDAEAAFDKRAEAARRYADELDRLNNRLRIGAGNTGEIRNYQPDGSFRSVRVQGIGRTEYERELRKISKAKEDAEARTTTTRSRQQVFQDFERELSARGISRAAGRTGYRSAADQNQIYRAGESPLDGYSKQSRHQSWQALDPTRASHDDVKAREAATAAGLKGFKIVTESGGRKHYEWTGAGQKGDADVAGSEQAGRAAETAAQRAERVREAEANRRRGFEGQLDQAQERFYRAQLALAGTSEERGDVEIQRLRAAAVQYQKDLEQQLVAGKLTEAEADKLAALNQSAYALEKIAAENREEQRLAQEQQVRLDRRLAMEQGRLGTQIAVLQLEGQLATTLKDRKRIALMLLDAEEKQARAAAQRLIDSDNPDDRREGRRQMAEINATAPLRREQVEEQFKGPLASYFDRLKGAVGDSDAIKQTLEGITVNGLDGMTDEFGRSVASALKLKGIAGEIVAELAKMELQKAILSIGSGGFFGLFSTGNVPGFADGIIRGPGTGTSDSIPGWMEGLGAIRVSNGESIMTAQATRRYGPMLKAMNDNRPLPGFATGIVPPIAQLPRIPSMAGVAQSMVEGRRDRVEVDARVSLTPSPLFEARMEEVSTRTVGRAAEPIMAGAVQRTRKALARPSLPGGYG